MKKFNSFGDIHFVTFRTFNNKKYFKDEKCCELFLDNLDFYRDKFKLKIYAYCIMPDHVHLLIYFEDEKLTISKIMHGIKGRSAQLISKYILTNVGSQSFYALAGEKFKQGIKALFTRRKVAVNYISTRDCLKIWQSDFYDFNIYSDKKFQEKLYYLHMNPLKSGLVKDISLYKYCSWQNYELNDQTVFKIDFFEY